MGEPKFKYYAEWEFADRDAFKEASRTPEFMETGKDAMVMGVPFHVHFAVTSSSPEPAQPRPLPPDELGFEGIVYEKAPPRATIRLNRPDVLNAFDFQMLGDRARVRGRVLG